MIGRRGFIGGCLAVLSSPIAFLESREKPVACRFITLDYGKSYVEIRFFRNRMEVWIDSEKWRERKQGSWTIFSYAINGLWGEMKARRSVGNVADIDYVWLANSKNPFVPTQNLKLPFPLMNKLYEKLAAKV